MKKKTVLESLKDSYKMYNIFFPLSFLFSIENELNPPPPPAPSLTPIFFFFLGGGVLVPLAP